MNKCRFRK